MALATVIWSTARFQLYVPALAAGEVYRWAPPAERIPDLLNYATVDLTTLIVSVTGIGNVTIRYRVGTTDQLRLNDDGSLNLLNNGTVTGSSNGPVTDLDDGGVIIEGTGAQELPHYHRLVATANSGLWFSDSPPEGAVAPASRYVIPWFEFTAGTGGSSAASCWLNFESHVIARNPA